MERLASQDYIKLAHDYSAPNYAPLDVVLVRGEGAWVWDAEGNKYLDMLSAYSAMNWGHLNKRIIERAKEQLGILTVTSRAFYNDQFSLFAKELAEFCNSESVLVMNSGAEAVETALKGARRWGYVKKGVEDGQAEVICFSGNFHGRTTTIVSFSDSDDSRKHFGPFTPGFKLCPYGDAEALASMITPKTVAVLVEPIQGEGGVRIPPAGFLRQVREICTNNNVLFLADEIQTGLCRTGKIFACDYEGVIPDLYIIGKSLGGGVVPISAVVGKKEILDLFTPGSHGSTFGGNPLACAIGREVLALIKEEKPHDVAHSTGEYLLAKIEELRSPVVEALRGRGLLIGIDVKVESGKAKHFCHLLKDRGLLCKDTRQQTIRLAPPLNISRDDVAWAIEQLKFVLV